MSLAKWPDLCIDYNEAFSTRAFQLFVCGTGIGTRIAKYNQQIYFEMPSKRFSVPSIAPIDHGEHLMTQGGFCFTYDKPASNLILFDCEYQQSQVFVWKKAAKGYQIDVSASGGRCLAVSQGAPNTKPADGAKIIFSDCTKGDAYELWTYDSFKEMLALATWPDLCMDLNEGSRNFQIYPCVLDANSGGKPKYNQVVKLEKFPYNHSSNYIQTTNFATPPVKPVDLAAYAVTIHGFCLDLDMTTFNLNSYDCKGASNNENQMFMWSPSQPNYHQIFTPLHGGLCIGVERPLNGGPPLDGAKVSFQKCVANDDYSQWEYNFTSKSLSLAKWWPGMCLDMSESTRLPLVHACTPDKGVFGVGVKSGGFFGFGASSSWYDQVVSFEMPDRRFGVPAINPIDNEKHLLTQGGYCLSFDQPAQALVMYCCEYDTNQVFIWKPCGSPKGHQLAVNTEDNLTYCLTTGSGSSSGPRPADGTKIVFADCATVGDYGLWKYDVNKQHVVSASWPDLCMDFNEGSRFFGVYTCSVDATPKFNQVINITRYPVIQTTTGHAVTSTPLLLPADGYEVGSSPMLSTGHANTIVLASVCLLASTFIACGLVCVARRRQARTTGDPGESEGEAFVKK
jgi:hypothetical protein